MPSLGVDFALMFLYCFVAAKAKPMNALYYNVIHTNLFAALLCLAAPSPSRTGERGSLAHTTFENNSIGRMSAIAAARARTTNRRK